MLLVQHTDPMLLRAIVPQYFQDKLAGYLMQKELNNADKMLKQGKRPFTAIIGGAKISDKIQPLRHLLNQVDYLLVGGGIANTFQKALGGQLGASLLENDQIDFALELVAQAQRKHVQLILPIDVVIAKELAQEAATRVVKGGVVQPGWMALDIGPQTQQAFASIIQASQTILWCGSYGHF